MLIKPNWWPCRNELVSLTQSNNLIGGLSIPEGQKEFKEILTFSNHIIMVLLL